MQKTLAAATFDLKDRKLNEEKIDAYLEISDYAFRFLYDKNSDFDYFYKTSTEVGDKVAPKWLNTSLKYLIWIEKFLALSTLIFAATPTIMVAALPSLFSVAMGLITPLLIILPPMTIAALAVGAILFGFKMAQLIMENASCKGDKVKKESNEVKQEAAGKLLSNHQRVSNMKDDARSRFFSLVPALNQKAGEKMDRTNIVF